MSPLGVLYTSPPADLFLYSMVPSLLHRSVCFTLRHRQTCSCIAWYLVCCTARYALHYATGRPVLSNINLTFLRGILPDCIFCAILDNHIILEQIWLLTFITAVGRFNGLSLLRIWLNCHPSLVVCCLGFCTKLVPLMCYFITTDQS